MSGLPFVPYPSNPADPSDAQSVPGMPSLALLMETDHLLDRLGDRGPRPADLDDPLAAALAMLAADVDIEPMPSNTTRRRLASVGAWPLRQDLRSAAFESLHHVIDIRGHADDAADHDTQDGVDGSAEDTVDDLDEGHRAGRLAQTREVGIRLVPALVAAGAAIVLSMGAAAALSSGETVNPAKVVGDIVQQFTGDTTTVSSPGGAGALAEAEGRGDRGLVPGGSPSGGEQPIGPGAILPGASVSPTAAPSGIAGADGTSPGTVTPGLLDFLPVLPAPTLPSAGGALPGSSSSAPGAGSSGTGPTGTGSTGTGSTGAASAGTSSSETSSTETSASVTESSSGSASTSEPTTPESTPSLGPTGSTTSPDPEPTTSPPETTSPTDSESVSRTVDSEHAASGESAVAQVRPFSGSSPLPTVAEALPASAIVSAPQSASGEVVATTPAQASLFASGGV